MAELTDTVVDLAIAMFFIASIFVAGLVQIASASYTSVDPNVKTLITIFVPTVATLALALALYREVKKRRNA